MSDSVRPRRWQPTRLPRPWNSPGKNTGVGCHFLVQCMKVKIENEVAQSCPTHGDPMDYSPLGSSIHGIFQARVLDWGAIAKGSKKKDFLSVAFLKNVCMISCFSCVWLFATLWTVAHQAPLSMGFSRQEYWSGLLWPPAGDLPNPGINPASPVTPALQADSVPLNHPGSTP